MTEEAESKMQQSFERCNLPMLLRSAIDVVNFQVRRSPLDVAIGVRVDRAVARRALLLVRSRWLGLLAVWVAR